MAKPEEIFPSSYRCECGHVSDFFKTTVNAIKAMSQKRKVRLGDSAHEEHTIVFYRGKAIEIICPRENKVMASKIREGTQTNQGAPDHTQHEIGNC